MSRFGAAGESFLLKALLAICLLFGAAGCSHPCGMFLSPDGKHVYSYRCR